MNKISIRPALLEDAEHIAKINVYEKQGGTIFLKTYCQIGEQEYTEIGYIFRT